MAVKEQGPQKGFEYLPEGGMRVFLVKDKNVKVAGQTASKARLSLLDSRGCGDLTKIGDGGIVFPGKPFRNIRAGEPITFQLKKHHALLRLNDLSPNNKPKYIVVGPGKVTVTLTKAKGGLLVDLPKGVEVGYGDEPWKQIDKILGRQAINRAQK